MSILSGLLLTSPLFSQSALTSLSTYRELNPWLEGSNPTGLLYNPAIPFSVVNAGYHYTEGAFRTVTDAPNIHRYNLSTESYRQLKKIQIHGRIGYTGEQQQHRQWSAMLQPRAHLISFGDTIEGTQASEEYNISGAVSIPLSSCWSIGGGLDYFARSNQKDTDPRNKNVQVDLLFSPGVIFSTGQYHIGANFIYHRIMETIDYTQLNQQAQNARTFYPLWFYIKEEFNNGLNSSRSYKDEHYGGALQFYTDHRKWEWFNEFRYTGSTGSTEISSSKGTKAGETTRWALGYRGYFRLRGATEHTLKVTYDHLSRVGYDHLQAKITNSTEEKVEDYGRIKRSAILSDKATLTYVLACPADTLNHRWAVHVRGCYEREEALFLVYPARFSQPITRFSFTTGYEQRIAIRKQCLEITTGLTYTSGHGSLLEASSENESSLPEIKIEQQYDLLLRDFHFHTAESLTGKLQLRYTHPVGEKYALSATAGTIYDRGISSECRGMYRLNSYFSAGFIITVQ